MPKSRPPYPAGCREQILELAKAFEPRAQRIRNWLLPSRRDAGERTGRPRRRRRASGPHAGGAAAAGGRLAGREPAAIRRDPAPDPRVRPAPERVERSCTAAAPDPLSLGDSTYLPTWAGSLSLATVLELFSRRVVGWAGGLDFLGFAYSLSQEKSSAIIPSSR
jgi:transposase InsO family protein